MGYYTYYSGEVSCGCLKTLKHIQELIENEKGDYGEGINVDFDGKKVEFSCEGKYYENQIQKLCLIIAITDKKAVGEIRWKGEDDLDMGEIKINDGKVFSTQAKIIYDKRDSDEFKIENLDIKTKTIIYNITKDKNLFDELTTEVL